jgi:hypothetical protein
MHPRNALPFLSVIVLSMIQVSYATGQCTINFDDLCPDSVTECDASFSGGAGCIKAGLGNCYDSGKLAYRLVSLSPVTVTLSTPVKSIDVFFAHTGTSTSGTMRFFAADSTEVDTPITTNGDCGGTIMPPTQQRNFSAPVWRIEVSVTGAGSSWIDSMQLNAVSVPVQAITWGLLKVTYP